MTGVQTCALPIYSHPDAWHPLAMGVAAGAFTFGVCIVSAFRNTHWLSDLLGGLFIGGALLVLVIAVDRFVPSKKQTR